MNEQVNARNKIRSIKILTPKEFGILHSIRPKISAQSIGKLLDITPRQAHALCKEWGIPRTKLGQKTVLYDLARFEAVLEELEAKMGRVGA